jgi:poly(3-hydroxybutyrate) depolymerase
VPTIVFHGDSDQTVHPSNGDELIARGAQPRHGASSESEPLLHERTTEEGEAGGRAYTRTTYRDSAGTPLMEQWIVHGAAHAWCGGSAKGSYCDPAGPDASREMLRFFLLHELPKECLCLA